MRTVREVHNRRLATSRTVRMMCAVHRQRRAAPSATRLSEKGSAPSQMNGDFQLIHLSRRRKGRLSPASACDHHMATPQRTPMVPRDHRGRASRQSHCAARARQISAWPKMFEGRRRTI